MQSPAVTFHEVSYSTGSGFAGWFGLAATGATLFPDRAFSATVSDGTDANSNAIDGNESMLVEGNFILASAGPDGIFTTYVAKEPPNARRGKMTKSDDIFNLER